MTVSISGTSGITFPDGSLQTAAASPFVLRNRIINGDMRIDQRRAGASVTITDISGFTYTLDRWHAYGSVASKFSVQQNAASVTPPTGFTNYFGATSLAATTVAATDQYAVGQFIEGFNIADLAWGTVNAQSVTLSFWVYSSLTGSFGGVLRNSADNYSYPFTYTISSANTWTKISITIAGATSGTWVTNNGIGVKLFFGLGVGSTFLGTAGSWSANAYTSSTGATNVVSTNGATFYITGVQLEVGTSATPFERRLYGQELANCQRYCEQLTVVSGSPSRLLLGMATAQSTTTLYGIYWYKVIKRVAPTTTITGTNQYRTLGPNQGSAITSIGTANAAPDTWFFIATSTGYTVGQTNLVESNDTATTTINWSAEL